MGWLKGKTEEAPKPDPLHELRKQVEAIEENLRKRKIADAELIQKPAGTYRIIKIEAAESPSGYFVQRWRVTQYGYQSYRQRSRARGYFYGLGEEYYLEGSVSEGEDPTAFTYIDWYNVGSSNPHSTHEDAAEWLRRWLRPEVSEVHYDQYGAPVTTEAQAECDGRPNGRSTPDASPAHENPSNVEKQA